MQNDTRPRVERLDLSGTLGPSPGYAYVARARPGAVVFTAGAVPLDTDGNLIGAGDLEAQTEAVIHNLSRALEAADADAGSILKTTIYVVARDRGDLGYVWRVFARGEYAAAPSTLLGVQYLGHEGQLVEIEAIAVVE